MTHATRGPVCRLCLARAEEISALKHIIAQQDERLLRMAQQRKEFHEQMESALARLLESQQMLIRQLEAGRKL